MKTVLFGIMITLLIISGFGLALLTKEASYNMYYKECVKKTITETVKDSALIIQK